MVIAALIALAAGVMTGPVRAQVSASDENKAFNAAVRAFEDGIFDRADKELAAFVDAFPRSQRVQEAILLRARAALEQSQPERAAELLNNRLPEAGLFADRFQYWLAETHLHMTNYAAAADAFARMIREFPASPRAFDAGYREAWARFQMGDTVAVIQLLQDPGGVFQRMVAEGDNPRLIREGQFLLAESLLRHERYLEAEKALRSVNGGEGTPELQWRRQHLLCKIQLAADQRAAALAGTTNLIAYAAATGQPRLQAESVLFQAEILEGMERRTDAIKSYEQNLAPNFPEPRRRQALLKIVQLTLQQNRIDEAIARLDAFLESQPGDPTGDIILLTVGELHLKQTAAVVDTNVLGAVTATNVPPTNHLQQALSRFNQLLSGFPNSPLRGKAQLGKGWCLWAANRISESEAAFQAAVDQLPESRDQAVALFKLADAQFRQNSFTNAIKNFQKLISRFESGTEIGKQLFAHAYYQILRASIEVRDLTTATAAMRKILADYPDSDFRDPGLLLVVQAVGSMGSTELARAIFDQYMKGFPEAPLLPEVQLALARTHVQDRDWPAAIKQYDLWITRFPTNELRPRAEFNRAWVYDKAGQATAALEHFTNFIARFPDDQLTPRARYWVGDYHYTRKQYVDAQIQYQKLAEAFPGIPLAYQARMMAGRAAFASGFWGTDAGGPSGHFTSLVTDERCPDDIKAEAYFALGDTMVAQGTGDTNRMLESFDYAIKAFSKIPSLYPTNRLVPLAWGRTGDCHLQLGAGDPKQYDLSTNAYQNVLNSPLADIAARSQAEIGIGLALEKKAQTRPSAEREALFDAARDRFLNVLYGSNLRNEEKPDPYWLKEAGLSAARLAESRQHWQVAANYYKRLLEVLPPLRPMLERRIERALTQQRQQAL